MLAAGYRRKIYSYEKLGQYAAEHIVTYTAAGLSGSEVPHRMVYRYGPDNGNHTPERSICVGALSLASAQIGKLYAMLDALPESVGVLKLRCEIPGYPSFFPGGHGYKGRSFPESPVMLIGHNFDTDVGFHRSVARGSEDHFRMKTWVNLKNSFLPTAKIKEDECFFTKLY